MTDREIYEEFRGSLMRFAASLVGTDAADDVVSDAVVRTLRRGRLASLDNPRAYLMQAVLNTARDRGRRLTRERAAVARHAGMREAVPVVSIESPELTETVMRLPVRQRAAVFLVYFEDMTSSDAAHVLGVRPATLRRYLLLSRRKLRGGSMSDERIRQVVRRAFTPVVSELGDGPSWDELVDTPGNPTRPAGPRVAVAAAAVVIAVIGITALVFRGGSTVPVTDPELSDPTPTTETTLGPDSTEPSQTTTPTSAPIDGADTAGQPAPGWEALGRLGAPRYHATTIDAGTALLVFGGGDDRYTGPGEPGFSAIWSGLAIDHVSGTVRNLPPSPMCESGIPAGVWTGNEFVIWGVGGEVG